LAGCIAEAREGIRRAGVVAEIIVADNGSTDGSCEIAARAGARVVNVVRRGYGSALAAGIRAARGTFVLFGDADGSYDFSRPDIFLESLRRGADLVVGNRFRGGIAPDAMPWLNRYVGNPILSGLLNLFYRTGAGDVHCGIRAFRRDAFFQANPRLPGMEIASELVIRFRQLGFRIEEIPVPLRKDGRGRAPHLRPYYDGLRHLRTILVLSPRTLFFVPGICLLVASPAAALLFHALGFGTYERPFGPNFQYTLALAALLGYQAISFGVVAEAMNPSSRRGTLLAWLSRLFESPWMFGVAAFLALAAVPLSYVALQSFLTSRTLSDPSLWIVTILLAATGVGIAFTSALVSIIAGAREDLVEASLRNSLAA